MANNYRNVLREAINAPDEPITPVRRVNKKTGEIAELKNGEYDLIGYTLDYVEELNNDLNTALDKAEEYQSKMNEYFEELVNAGLRERPKTQEDIINEVKEALTKQESINLKLLEMMEQQQAQINKLSIGGVDNNEHDKQSVAETKSSKPGNSKTSRGTTTELPIE